MKGTARSIGRVLALVFSLGVVALGDRAFAQDGTWTTRTGMPTARNDLGAAVIDGVLYTVGGSPSEGGFTGALEAYDPMTDSWSIKRPMPTPRNDFGVGVVDGILYVVGGCQGFCTGQLDTVEAYDPATDTWSTKSPMPTARFGVRVGVVDGTLYAVGGHHTALGTLGWVEAYDPMTDAWVSKHPMPTPRARLAVGVVGGILYAVGGGAPVGVVEAYDPATDSWTSRAEMPTARSLFDIGVLNGLLYAVGGHDGIGGAVATVEAYDPRMDRWTSQSPMPTARWGVAVGVVDGTLYAVGGITGNVATGGSRVATTEAFTAFCPDRDGDTFADCTAVGCDPTGRACGDCDDADPSVFPDAPETCDGQDDDCDGSVDEPGSEASCSLPNAMPRCENGACVIGACTAGFADCDSNPRNGCETDMRTDSNNCGGCGQVCSNNHITTPTCSGGVCTGSCDSGWADCNGNKRGDGCETPLDAIPNCGACGQTCDDGSACTNDICSGGTCRNIDRSQCAVPACGSPPGCSFTDTDGDGLNNTWEANGYIDLDCDGVQGAADLPLLGADPAVKDLYVKYDYMVATGSGAHSHQPATAAIDMVVDAFAGQSVRVHVDPAPEALPHHDVVTLGPPPPCAGPDAVDFYALKAAHFDPKQRFTHRYVVFGHLSSCNSIADCASCPAVGGTAPKFQASGLAEIGGNDVVISLSGYPSEDPTSASLDQRVRMEAGTLMHELGHNLDLRHGGADDVGQKPNYFSVMNYWYQLTGILKSDAPGSIAPVSALMDFSFGALPALAENHLNESTGVSAPAASTDITLFYCDGGLAILAAPSAGPLIDWNCISPDNEPDVASDINGDGVFSILEGFNDWSSLDFRFQCSPTFADGPPPASNVSASELDLDTARNRHVLFPFQPIRIDIRPGAASNFVTLGSAAFVPVAAFGAADFDVMHVDPSSLRFAGASPVSVQLADIDRDARLDLLTSFRMSDLNLTSTSTSASLTGSLRNSQAFGGSDSVVVRRSMRQREPTGGQ